MSFGFKRRVIFIKYFLSRMIERHISIFIHEDDDDTDRVKAPVIHIRVMTS